MPPAVFWEARAAPSGGLSELCRRVFREGAYGQRPEHFFDRLTPTLKCGGDAGGQLRELLGAVTQPDQTTEDFGSSSSSSPSAHKRSSSAGLMSAAMV